MASPYTIIECEGDEADIEAIVNIITRQEVGLVIVGLPHSKIGDIGVQAKKVMGFALKLKEHISVPVEFRDERLTTVLAKQLKKTGKNMKSKDKVRYDDVAAAIILQTYLDETYSNNLQ